MELKQQIANLLQERGESFLADNGVDISVCQAVAEEIVNLIGAPVETPPQWENAPKILVDAVETHGEAEGPEHMLGDIEQIIDAAWTLLTPSQRTDFMRDYRVRNVMECGMTEGDIESFDSDEEHPDEAQVEAERAAIEAWWDACTQEEKVDYIRDLLAQEVFPKKWADLTPMERAIILAARD